MNPSEPLDIDTLRRWIGRVQEVHDTVTPRLLAGFNSCFDGSLAAAGTAADAGGLLGLHWCLAPDAAPLAALDTDGHAARGGFLPPVPLPHRMWAGGLLKFHDQLRPGDSVTRRATVEDVTLKEGRTGPLLFVAVRHEYSTPRGPALTERRDIVYRDDTSDNRTDVSAGSKLKNKSVPLQCITVAAGPVLLFRYSALTFNSHRIHYDRSYCLKEGYPGLLVHGPLQATLLLRFGAAIRTGAAPRLFEYRAIRPLFDGQDFSLNAGEAAAGMEFWINDADGFVTMTAKGTW